MTDADASYADALPIGTRIGPIVLGGAIGQGAEGIVYLADHDRLGRVVVKEYWPKQIVSRSSSGTTHASQPGWQDAYRRGRTRFADLGERLCAIDPHPNIVRFHESVDANKTCYLVMRHVLGTPLSALLASGHPMRAERVQALADGLTAALDHLHSASLTHRDIAPDNVIMAAMSDAPVLIDLNAAKDEIHAASHSMQGLVKPGYSPIEQYHAEDPRSTGPWSDIYATAAVLYRAITGKTPEDAGRRAYRDGHEPLTALAPAGYAPAFLAAIDHGLERQPDDRPQSARAWRKALGFDQDQDELLLIEAVPPQARARSGRAVWFGGAAAMLTVILAGAIWAVWPRPSGPGKPAAVAVTDGPAATNPLAPEIRASPTPGPTLSPNGSPTAKPTPVAVASPTPERRRPDEGSIIDDMTPAACSPGPYIVFFDPEKSNLTPNATGILANAAKQYADCGDATVNISANLDKDRATSQRRARSVADYLSSHGVPVSNIRTSVTGEPMDYKWIDRVTGRPAYERRRVEITYGPG